MVVVARTSKLPVVIHVPEPFRAFMREVKQLILDGDDAATIESDDLLQCERAYGGLYDAENNRFGFRYFPGDDTQPTWDFDLSRDDIFRIAAGEMTQMTLYRCKDDRCRCLVPRPEWYCTNCDNPNDFA
jgi:hypothetical protein